MYHRARVCDEHDAVATAIVRGKNRRQRGRAEQATVKSPDVVDGERCLSGHTTKHIDKKQLRTDHQPQDSAKKTHCKMSIYDSMSLFFGKPTTLVCCSTLAPAMVRGNNRSECVLDEHCTGVGRQRSADNCFGSFPFATVWVHDVPSKRMRPHRIVPPTRPRKPALARGMSGSYPPPSVVLPAPYTRQPPPPSRHPTHALQHPYRSSRPPRQVVLRAA